MLLDNWSRNRCYSSLTVSQVVAMDAVAMAAFTVVRSAAMTVGVGVGVGG